VHDVADLPHSRLFVQQWQFDELPRVHQRRVRHLVPLAQWCSGGRVHRARRLLLRIGDLRIRRGNVLRVGGRDPKWQLLRHRLRLPIGKLHRGAVFLASCSESRKRTGVLGSRTRLLVGDRR
jgi:hypothetical protein